MQKLLTELAITAAAALAIVADCPAAGEIPEKKEGAVKIHIKVDGKTLAGTLADNAIAKDFAALLPLSLTLKNYASTEKISYMPRKLSTKGAPAGCDPEIGDITYYAPWGNLAIFYKDFGYSEGLIKLGKIDGAVDALAGKTELKATIDLAR